METKHIIILTLILLTSGCVDQIGEPGQSQAGQKGLEIEEFSITDDRLRPEQNAVITARFKNYHRDIEVHTVEIFNEGSNLDVSKNGCTPSIGELESARKNVYPEMQCTWTVKAPGQETLEGFRERSEPVKLRASYSGSLENKESLKAEFRSITDIEKTSRISRVFSNGEIEARMTTETPIAKNSGNSIELQVRNDGPGRIEGPYSFEYTPSSVFEGCDSEASPSIGSEWSTVCTLSSGSEGVRNLFFSTDYKYIKEPNLDITLVNRR